MLLPCELIRVSCRRLSIFYATTVFLLFSNANARTRSTTNEIRCENIGSQKWYSLHDMTGFWYGIEIVEHITPKSAAAIESCIKVELRKQDESHVNLVWKERNLDVTYKFVIDDKNEKGIWTSLGNQDVNDKPSGVTYEQFAGKVFVIKASDSNVVLTFCSLTKLFTLVLSKSYIANTTELNSIRGIVERFTHSQIKNVRRYCRNGAAAAAGGTQKSLLLLLLVAACATTAKLFYPLSSF